MLPSFTLYSTDPSTLSLNQGASTALALRLIEIDSQYGFSGNVTLSASGLPERCHCILLAKPHYRRAAILTLVGEQHGDTRDRQHVTIPPARLARRPRPRPSSLTINSAGFEHRRCSSRGISLSRRF